MNSLDERTGQAGSTNNLIVGMLAALPTDGLENGAAAFVTDGRKSSEAEGLGTGCPAYWNRADLTWRAYYDDAEVQV